MLASINFSEPRSFVLSRYLRRIPTGFDLLSLHACHSLTPPSVLASIGLKKMRATPPSASFFTLPACTVVVVYESHRVGGRRGGRPSFFKIRGPSSFYDVIDRASERKGSFQRELCRRLTPAGLRYLATLFQVTHT